MTWVTSARESTADANAIPSLGQQTTRGLVWLVSQSVVLKVISAGAQLLLSWFLLPRDFGLIAMAYTAAAVAGVLQQTGIREILISRQRRFHLWANAGFWMSLAMGIIAAALLIAILPFLRVVYPHITSYELHTLAGLIAVLAANCPLAALSVVPSAQLTAELRFGTVAKIGLWTSSLQIGLAPLLALLGCGAYSFVLPRVVASATQLIWMWRATTPAVRLRMQWRRWRLLAADSGYNLTSLMANLVVTNGDYFVLSLIGTTTALGLYYFAFNLSLQTTTLLVVNLWGVLLPALAQLRHDPQRQTRAFLRAARLLAIISMPLSLLQAASAAPVIHLLFQPRWYPAIPALQILSVGMSLQVVGASSLSLIQAQGRFKTQMWLTIGSAGLFLAAVMMGASAGGFVSLAVAVGAYYAVIGPVTVYVAVREHGGTLTDSISVFAKPLMAASVSAGAGMAAAMLVPEIRMADFLRIVITVVVTSALYVPSVALLAPSDWEDLKRRAAELPAAASVRALAHRCAAALA